MLLDKSGQVSTGGLKQMLPVHAARSQSRLFIGFTQPKPRAARAQTSPLETMVPLWQCSSMINLTCCAATSCLPIIIRLKQLIFCTDQVILWNLFRQLRVSTPSCSLTTASSHKTILRNAENMLSHECYREGPSASTCKCFPLK